MKAAIIYFLVIFAVVAIFQVNAKCTPGTDTGVGWFFGCPLKPHECNSHCLSLNNGYTSGGCNVLDCTYLLYYHGSEGCDATKIAWIGLHYNATNKSWKWSDESKTDFLNWMPGEPNNTDRDDCGLLNIASNCGYNSSLISDYYYYKVAARYICKMLPATSCKISN